MSIRAKFYTFYFLTAITYLVVNFLAPLSTNRFNLSASETHWLQLAILIPVLIVWGLAIFGAARLLTYTKSIVRHPDGKAMHCVAKGLGFLACSYLVSGLFSTLRPWALRDGWLPTYTVISNYILVIFSLVAFGYMYKGSLELRKLTKAKTRPVVSTVSSVLFLAVVAIVYLAVLSSYQYLESTPDPTLYSSYYMHGWAVVLTIGLPYLLSWALGMIACVNIATYHKDVKGVIYKKMLYRLSIGIFMVVAFSILLQMLLAFSTFFARAGLNSIIAIVYLILLAYAAGYLVIVSGVRKLNLIEKV
jgi:hypothetical protein